MLWDRLLAGLWRTGRQSHSGYAISDLNLYPGYALADLDVLRQFSGKRGRVEHDRIIDGFGRVSLRSALPAQIDFAKLNVSALDWPVPDDGYMSEASEYIATALAVDRAGRRFRMAELGAGWGPWSTLAAAMCRKRDIDGAHFLTCEAMPSRIRWLESNLAANQLTMTAGDANGFTAEIVSGAISDRRERVKFPEAPDDMGAAIGGQGDGVDYRGVSQNYVEVECRTLEDVLGPHVYDFVHVDIQGAELDALRHCPDYLRQHVRSIFIGTHSRPIEGELIVLMEGLGFSLRLEKPCRFALGQGFSSLLARTTHDGSQYWMNESL